MKQIRIFSDTNKFSVAEDVNDFIKDCKYEILDIQYSSASSALGSAEYSVMVVFEENN